MQIGVDSFVATAKSGPIGDAERVQELLEQIELATRSASMSSHRRTPPGGLCVLGARVLMAAAAARTKRIRLASAVTVLSSDDPVRVFQQFATVTSSRRPGRDHRRARSFIESYPLFGFDLDHYDELFSEKLELLLKLRAETKVTGQGSTAPRSQGRACIRAGAESAAGLGWRRRHPAVCARRAGSACLAVAIIGGQAKSFRPLVDSTRVRPAAGHARTAHGRVHSIGFLADTTTAALERFGRPTATPSARSAGNAAGRRRRGRSSMPNAVRTAR